MRQSILIILVLSGWGFSQNKDAAKTLDEAFKLYQKGSYDMCISLCNEMLKTDSKYSDAYFRRGWAYFRLNKYEMAEDDFDKAIKYDKSNPRPFNGRANARCFQKKYLRALNDCRKALKLDPDYCSAYITKCLCFKGLKMFDAAREAIDKAIEIEPRNIVAWNNSGVLFFQTGSPEKAVEAYDMSLGIDDNNPFAHINRARACVELKQYEEVVKDATWAIEHDAYNAIARQYRGKAYESLGKPELAKVDYQIALELNPNDRVSAEGLESVQKMIQSSTASKHVASGTSTKKTVKKTSSVEPKEAPQVVQSQSSPTPEVSAPLVQSPQFGPQEIPQIDFKFLDPCEASSSSEGALWSQTNQDPITEKLTGGVVLAPFVELKGIADSQYNGMVSMAMEGMRMLYGELSEKQEQHFQKIWAPMFDFPTKENLLYLQELVPLIGQYTAGREAFLRAIASIQTLQYELALAVAADSQEGYEAIMTSAVDVNFQVQALLNGMKQIALKIEELGNPPNPLDEKCQAQQRYRKRFPKKESRPHRGLEGEWVGYVESDSNLKYMRRMPLQYLFQYHMEQNPFVKDPMEMLWGAGLAYIGSTTATQVYWTQDMVDNLDGDVIEYDYESEGKEYHLYMERVDGDLPEPFEGLSYDDVKRLKNLEKSTREDWYKKNKIKMSEDTPSSDEEFVKRVEMPSEDGEEASQAPAKATAPEKKGGITYYHTTNEYDAKELEMGLELHDISISYERLEEYLQRREIFHVVCQSWQENPPEESFDESVRLKEFNSRLRQVETQYQKEIAEANKPTEEEIKRNQEAKKAAQEEVERQEGIKESIAFHESIMKTIERDIKKEQAELANENDSKRRKQLAFRLIQLQSNLQAERDLVDSYKTGEVIHRRSVFDEFAHQKFVNSIKERVARVDAVRRMKRSIERQIELLPEDRRADLKKIANRILDPKSQAMGNVSKARRLVVAVNNQVQGYWEHEGAMQESRVAELDESEFYLQATVMASGGLTVSLGAAALATTFGETAALAVWGPHLIGGVYGGTTGYIIGGPREALKQSVSGLSPYGAFAAEFVDTWLKESENPKTGWQTKLWNSTANAGFGFCMGKAVEFAANTVVQGGLAVFGPESALFKPVFSSGGLKPHINLTATEAAKTQQAVDDAMQYMGVFKEKQLQLMKLKAKLPSGSPEITQLDQELTQMAASINSSFHGKWLMKYKAHPSVRKFFNTKVNKSYDDMMPEMRALLKNKGYDLEGLKFKSIRNASSAGSSSMDLDLALMERPGMEIRKNGKIVSVLEFQRDAQGAMNVAYHNQTGYSATRSELNFTTSAHDEAFSNMKLLREKVRFSEIDQKDIASIGKVVKVKVDKIENDPVLTQIAKSQARCRESNKEIKNMLLKRLQQQLESAPPGSKQVQQLEADIRYWKDMSKRFDEMGTQETNPFRLLELEREIRMETGGKGSQEVIQDLMKMFNQ